MYTGGYLNTHLAQPFRWLRYTSMFSYSLSALAIIEFQLGSPLGFVLFILVYVATSNNGHTLADLLFATKVKKGKGVCKLFVEIRLTTTDCHLPYGITQCYLSPDTSEHTPPLPQPDRLVLDLPTI